MKQLLATTTAFSLLLGTVPVWADAARFASPEAAVDALEAALDARDREAVLGIFGPESEDILSTGDQTEDREVWGDFLDDLRRIRRLETGPDGAVMLNVGRDNWPFPAPIVETDGMWSFDAEAAREEVLMRRIGGHELAVIEIMERIGDIQASYRRTDHDGDGVMEFAASILSSPGARDGLFWPEEEGGQPSPFNGDFARANFFGFSEDGADVEPEPFEGYYFRILQGQGEAAPGGAYSYMIGGNMVAGHALVAYPATYGDTGIMSFMVGEDGVVLEADLGENTLARALEIELYDPGEDWMPVE